MSRSGRVLPLTLGLALTLTTLTYAAPARPRCLPDVVPAPFVYDQPLPASPAVSGRPM